MILSQKTSGEKNLTDLYEELGNLKHDFRNYNLNRLILSKIKGKSILDIGCGAGHLLNMLDKKGKKAFGIESNKDLIKLAKHNNPRLSILCCPAEHINKLKEKVDTITTIDVLEHIKDDKLQVKKIYEYMDKGGQLIIIVPALKFLYGERDKKFGHYRRYSKKELYQKLSRQGFKIQHIRFWNMAGFIPYLFYEKVLKKDLNTNLRTKEKKGILNKTLSTLLNLWFKYIENNFDFGFGLSLICVATKN